MTADFSERFIALRDKIEASLDPRFSLSRGVDCSGKMAALRAEFHTKEVRKLMGLMPTSRTTHCHEFRMLFAAPVLSERTFPDWWDFAVKLLNDLVPVDPFHEFTMISVILVTDEADKAVVKQLKRKEYEPRYASPDTGWSSLRIAVVDLSARKIHVNRMGGPLRDVLKSMV